MPQTLPVEVYQDDIAVALARVMAAANKHARQMGVDAHESLITISHQPRDGGLIWRVSYGPKDYIGRRGGDLIIDVDPYDGCVQQVLHGQ